MPVVIGAGGCKRVLEITLSAEEKTALDDSAASVRRNIDALPE